jgi:phi13 family phage major tail protein
MYPLIGAKTASVNRAASLVTNFADNKAFETMESTGEKGMSLSIVDILPEDYARIFGHTYLNGSVSEKNSDQSPDLCLAFRTELTGGAYGYVYVYKVKFGKPNWEDATREASPSPRAITVEGRISDLVFNGMSIDKLRSDDPAADATRLANWFTTPTFQTAETGAITVAAAAGTAGQVVFTFTKAGGNTVMNQATFIVPNIQIFLNSTGAVQAPTWAFGASGGATQTATASGCTAGASQWLVSNAIKDANGIGVTAKGGAVTIT